LLSALLSAPDLQSELSVLRRLLFISGLPQSAHRDDGRMVRVRVSLRQFRTDRTNTMSNERIRALLKELRTELDTKELDAETLALIREVDAGIQSVLDSSGNPVDAMVNRAKALEVKFSVNHRVAERILREIIDTLAKIGV
jgi:chorismate mutase